MINDFHTKEAEALLAKFRQIENIIGSRTHSPTDGAHCEALLREYLRGIMPKTYSVDTGFLYDCQRTSRQIDILIHDESKLRPLYKFDECVIIHPDSLVAAIEVKKKLTKARLKEAVDALERDYSVAFDLSGIPILCDDPIGGLLYAAFAVPHEDRML